WERTSIPNSRFSIPNDDNFIICNPDRVTRPSSPIPNDDDFIIRNLESGIRNDQPRATPPHPAPSGEPESRRARSGHFEDVRLVPGPGAGQWSPVGAPGKSIGHGVGGDALVEQGFGAGNVPDEEVAAVADGGQPLPVGTEPDGIDIVRMPVQLV